MLTVNGTTPPVELSENPLLQFPLQGWQQRKGGGKVQFAFFLSIPLPLPSVVEVLLPLSDRSMGHR